MSVFSRLASLATALLLGLALWATLQAPPDEAAATVQPPEPAPLPVRTAPLVQAPAREVRTFHGRLQAVESSRLSLPAGGRILDRSVERGQSVRRGEVLFRLDPAAARHQVQGLQARLRELEARRGQITRTADRARRLLDVELGSLQAVEEADTGVQELDAALDGLRVALADARRQQSDTVLTAPWDGVVTEVLADVGAVVAPGQALVDIQVPDRLEVHLLVGEDIVLRLDEGMPLTLHFPLSGVDARPARVSRIARAAVPGAGLFPVVITPDTAADLVPGLTVDAHVDLPAPAGWVVPTASLQRAHGGPALWVERGGRAVPLAATLLRAQGDALVVAVDVQPGDRLVVAGAHRLTAGARVAPVAESAR
jgi:RND family efflux transporter MFP subunit